MSLNRRHLMVAAILAIPVLAGVAFFAVQSVSRSTRSVGGPFRLHSMNGDIVDTAQARGPYAVFFGFTRCPDICPTTMSELTQTLAELGESARAFRVFFVSVDPERDTPALLKEYLSNFDSRIVGLTGTPSEIAAVAKQYRAVYEKIPTSDGDYTMNHTAIVYLMDGTGKLSDVVGYGEPHDSQVQKFRKLLEQ